MKMLVEGGDREEEWGRGGVMDGAGKHVSTGGCSRHAASQVRRPSRLTLGCHLKRRCGKAAPWKHKPVQL